MTNPYKNLKKDNCKFCDQQFFKGKWMEKHQLKCVFHPNNVKLCINCGQPVKNLKSKTCSYECSNTKFPRRKKLYNNYRDICFEKHEKKCIICGEDKIVAVHHFDHNRTNNYFKNLIPLCPTHHAYMHSGHKHLIEKIVLNYIEQIN